MENKEQSLESEVRMVNPFAPNIMDTPLSKDFQLQTIKVYTRTSGLRTQMTIYKVAMVMIGTNDVLMCKEFLSTLDGMTKDWFNTLSDGSV